MKFFALDPEVAGELGKNTVMDTSVHPPVVSRLHYELDAWLGDDLIQSFPCYLVSDRLKKRLENAPITGVSFAPVELTVSANFKEHHRSKPAPKFAWLKVVGCAEKDDFGVEADGVVVVSEQALNAMQALNLKHCKISKR